MLSGTVPHRLAAQLRAAHLRAAQLRAAPASGRPASGRASFGRRSFGRRSFGRHRPGQCKPAVGQGIDQAVGDEAVQGPGKLDLAGPDRVEVGPAYRLTAIAQHRKQPAAALPVRAVVTLGSAPGCLHRFPGVLGLLGATRSEPGAIARHRAGAAARVGGRAYQRAQFHHRDGPAGRDRGLAGQQRFGQLSLGYRQRDARHGLPGDEPGQHAPHVGVEHGVPLAEGEAGHGRGGIAADPRQREQGVQIRRHHPAVPRGQDGRRLVQPERAPGIAEPAPLPDRLARRLGRERGRGGPPGDPPEVFGQHPGHRRLLQHDLTDQHRPGRDARSAPGQVPRVTRIPGQHRLGVGRRHDAPIVARFRSPGQAGRSDGRAEPNGSGPAGWSSPLPA